MKYYKYGTDEWKAQQEEIRRNRKTEEEWRQNVKPGDKAIQYRGSGSTYGHSQYTDVIVNRVTKTKIIIGPADDRFAWEKDFRRDDGREFTKYSGYERLMSPNAYNLVERDEELEEGKRLRLIYDIEDINWRQRSDDIETLLAVKAILDAADEKKALDNSAKVD